MAEPSGERVGSDLGWWTISGAVLLDALGRAHRGEDPDLIYAEMYANSDHETEEGTNDDA